MNNVYAIFKTLEQRHSLFELECENLLVWERIRFRVYRNLQESLGIAKAHKQNSRDVFAYIRATFNLLKNTFYRNPFISNSADVLFIGHPRRKLLEDGLYWDIYCDPIIEYLAESCLCLEKPYLMSHKIPPRTKRLRYLDLPQYIFRLIQISKLVKYRIDEDKIKRIDAFTNDIISEFDVRIDPLPLVRQTLLESQVLGKLYKIILRQVSPKAVILVISYEHEVLIDACRDLGITTIELQHGVIYEGHPGYSYPKDVNKSSFPDYLLTFGDYWAESMSFPVESERIVPIGYPYLDMRVQKFKEVKKRDQVLFISQGPIGRELSRMAVMLSNRINGDIDVVYKLHPGEYGRWKEEYPWLKDSKVVIIDSDRSPLYRLMAESRVQIGVGSTALFEGLAFNLQTLIFDIPGNEPCLPLIRSNQARLFSSVDELVDIMSFNRQESSASRFFKPNSLNRLQTWLSQTILD